MNKLLAVIRAHQADISALLFLAAGLSGVCLQSLSPGDPGAEMMTLADNFARHGSFANPFFVLATGPTAVNPPLYPIMVSVLIKLLRVPALVYYATVTGSILVNAVTATLLPRLSVLFFRDAVPGVIAALLWLATMRVMPGWDTSYTLAGLLLFCLVSSSALQADEARPRRAVLAGVIAGLLFLLNPSALLIAVPWLAYLVWRAQATLIPTLKRCAILLAVVALFVCGWCGRNYLQLGAFVARTNLGMTLYSSNNDCAESSMFRDQLSGCYQANHPNDSLREAQLLQQMNEIGYDRMRIADAKRWALSHPRQFLNLTSRRLLEFWFPAVEALGPYQDNALIDKKTFDWLQNWARQQNQTACAIWIVTALSLPGLFVMLRRQQPVVWFVLAVLAVYPLMYYVVVSDIRYRYPVLWLSLLPAGYWICTCLELWSRSSATKPAHSAALPPVAGK